MEQTRFFLAIALSFLVFLLWELIVVEKKDTTNIKQAIEQTEKIEQSDPEVPYLTQEEKDALLKDSISSTEPLKASRIITIETPMYAVNLSEKGGVIKSFVLKKYKENISKDSLNKELIPPEIQEIGTFKVYFENNPKIMDEIFFADTEESQFKITEKPLELTLKWQSQSGLVIEKQFSFYPDTYLIDFKLTIKNGTDKAIKDNLVISLINKAPPKVASYTFDGPSFLINSDVKQINLDKLNKNNPASGDIKWVSFGDRYFMTSVIPLASAESSVKIIKEENIVETKYFKSIGILRADTMQQLNFKLYFGPKKLSMLKKVGYNIDESIDFGMFGFLAIPCLWIMNFIYTVIPNYGIAIILLTILIKLIFWPLGTKSYKSMNEMKKIQPLLTQIREKYKDDKQKVQMEMMNLYKVYKINPLGGCLPMLVQIPVFFAFYRMLYESIELRHAYFFGWINDLSAPDRLFNFGFTIPFMEPPYGIPVLTVIMGATMLLQQQLSPPPGDPMQAKMMMLLPIIFTVIFINFPAGLVLYWLVNNIISIAQQYYTTKNA
ncbi:MAG: membrane protein insertase YidC [Desulfobacterales bacterium]|nr:membrane protein insertase YidC [Desulfobacterales bacterium]